MAADEIALLKGHRYMTVVLDYETSRVVYDLYHVVANYHRTLRSPWAVRRALGEWREMAEESGIEPLEKFAASLKKHQRGIVAHAAYPIHTGRLEGVNNKIKVIKRRSYGFRDPTYFTLKVKQAFPGN